jgi:hypothetical protein
LTTAPAVSSIFAPVEQNAYTTYRVRLHLHTLAGGTPADPQVIKGWVRAKMVDAPDDVIREAVASAVAGRVKALEAQLGRPLDMASKDDLARYEAIMEAASDEAATMRALQGFLRDDRGIFVEARHIKAMLKEAVNIAYPYELQQFGYGGTTKDGGEKKGRKGGKSFLAETVFVEPYRVYLRRDGQILSTPDRVVQSFVSNPRTGDRAIQYSELVEAVTVEFLLKVDLNALNKQGFREEMWPAIWLRAEKNGLGAMRSQSYGQFATLEFSRIA